MISEFYKDRKVLVTGHTGFKGSWLTLWLLKMGANVFGLSKSLPTEPSLYQKLNLQSQVKNFNSDITDREEIISVFDQVKPDVVFHLAAQPIVSVSYQDPVQTFMINGMGTAHILDALRELKHLCSVIVVTSDKCYQEHNNLWGYRESDPLGGKDPYSASKSIAEHIAYSYTHSFFMNEGSNVRLATGRAGNVIGGGDWSKDRIVPDCMNAWYQKLPMRLRSPKAIRPWQHVLDAVNGYLMLGCQLAQQESLNGEAFNFGPPISNDLDVQTLVEGLAKAYGSRDAYEVVDNSVKESHYLRLNSEKSIKLLNWYPKLDFQGAVSYTASWYKAYHTEPDSIIEYTDQQLSEFIERSHDM